MIQDIKTAVVIYLCVFIAAVYGLRLANTVSFQEPEKVTAAPATKTVTQPINKTLRPENLKYLRCLADNIYYEAAGEPFMGQVAVARVVMNRVKHGFAANPCKVIYQITDVPHPDNPEETRRICQFSWVCDNPGQPANNRSYLQAQEIAKRVLVEDAWKDSIPGNILFFHNTSVDPSWSYKRVMTIGNHVFYAKK